MSAYWILPTSKISEDNFDKNSITSFLGFFDKIYEFIIDIPLYISTISSYLLIDVSIFWEIVSAAESVIRYREGDYNEKVFVKGDGNATPATPEEIISLSKRKYGVDNETSEIIYEEEKWSQYIELCKEYRRDGKTPTVKVMVMQHPQPQKKLFQRMDMQNQVL